MSICVINCFKLTLVTVRWSNRRWSGSQVVMPLWIGLHLCYNGKYSVLRIREESESIKNYLSSDCFWNWKHEVRMVSNRQ